mmetsp:Transcript_49975/g.156377  ORF Transcript_49975/g.156377 Transcript_49975/m.156377 type:complete len:515 (-) Transcript_49975:29-1573(-)
MHDASLDQIVVDVDVQLELVLLRELLRQLEGHFQLPPAVGQLHQDGEGEVAGAHTNCLHVLENLHTASVEALARTAIEERVVGLLVDAYVIAGLHRLDQLEGPVQLVQLAEALEHRTVGHDVWRDAALDHLLQEPGRAADLPAASAGVDERVVGHAGELRPKVLSEHLLIESPDAVEALLVREALQDGAVDHGVDRLAGVGVCQHLAEQLVSSIRLLVGHKRLHGAAHGDAGGQDVASAHLLPSGPHALDVADKSEGADDAAVGVGVEGVAGPPGAVPAEQPREQVAAGDPNAGLQRRAQQDLVHVAAEALEGGERAVHVHDARAWLHALEEDGAGDAVGPQAAGLHLLDQPPRALDVRSHRHVQQLIEGHDVGLQTRRAHGHDGVAGRLDVAAAEVCLDHGVVGHDVRVACVLGLRHDTSRSGDVPALHAGVQEAVVEPGLAQAAPPHLLHQHGRLVLLRGEACHLLKLRLQDSRGEVAPLELRQAGQGRRQVGLLEGGLEAREGARCGHLLR